MFGICGLHVPESYTNPTPTVRSIHVEPREVGRLSPAHDKHPANEPQMKDGPEREDCGGGGNLNQISILLEEVRCTVSDEPDAAILDGDDEQHAEACVDVVVKARPVGYLGQDVADHQLERHHGQQQRDDEA